jgi:hypothetical protein
MSNTGFSFKSSGLYGLIVGVITLVALFYVAKGIFWVLTWVSPVLLIAALVIDYQVVVDYLKMLWNMVLRSPITGILFSVISFVAFPVTILYLFGRAWFGYYIRKKQREQAAFFQQFNENNRQAQEDEFVAYEEIKDGFLGDSTNEPLFSNKEKQNQQR